MKQETQTLSTVCAIKNGFAFKSRDYLTKGIPLLRISNFNDGEVYINDNQIYVDDKYLKSKNDFIVEKGDVLIALSGATTGKYGIYNFDFPSLLNQRIGLIKSGESDTLNSRYFFYYLNILKSEILRNAGGAAQPNISTKKIGTFEIPLPPLETQKRIAQILDDAAALRDTTVQLLKEYDLLAQSIFLEMFGDPVVNPMGWRKTKGSNLYNVKGRVGWKGYKKTDLRDSGPVVLGATHIDNSGNIELSKSVHLTREKFLESPEIIIEKNDLIFVQRGNTIGKIGLVNFDIGEATINPVVLILRTINQNNPYFILHLMMNKNLKKEVIDLNSGSAQPMITQKSIKDYEIIHVPTELQNQFADKIALIEQQKALAKQEFQESEDLFNCLLQKAFKGELV